MNLISKVATTTTSTATITADDLQKALGLPKEAKIYFDVPGGGDWSNERIQLDNNEHGLTAVWKTMAEDAEHRPKCFCGQIDVDRLAAIIRQADGNNSLGAAELAERILAALE